MVIARINGLPDDSAFRRKYNDGWTSIHELLASIHDRVTTTAHGWRLEGRPQRYPRPDQAEVERREAVDLSNPRDAAAITRFFGRPTTE